MLRAKVIFGIGLLAIAGVILTLFFRSSASRSGATLQAAQAQKIVLYGYDGENLAWCVRANKGTLREEEGRLVDAEVSFYAEQEEELNITAELLLFEPAEMTLSGRVTASHRDGYTLQAPTLTWTEASNELVGNDIQVIEESAAITAAEFRYELENRRAWLIGGMKASLFASPPNEDQATPSLNRERVPLGTLTATRALLTDEGMTAYENVHLILHPDFFGASDGV